MPSYIPIRSEDKPLFTQVGQHLRATIIRIVKTAVHVPQSGGWDITRPMFADDPSKTPIQAALHKNRTRLHQAQTGFASARLVYFEARHRLELARAEFRRVAQRSHLSGSHDVPQSGDDDPAQDPDHLAIQMLHDTQSATSLVLKTVHCTTSKIMWEPHEAAKEAEYLSLKVDETEAATRVLQSASKRLFQANSIVKDATRTLRAKPSGQSAGAEIIQLSDAQRIARTDIIRRMLADDKAPEEIAEMTGFDAALIEAVRRDFRP